jgi:hypothetical protein
MALLAVPPALGRVLLRPVLDRVPHASDVLVGWSTASLIAAATFLAVPRMSPAAVLSITALTGLVAVGVGRLALGRLGPGVAVAGGVGVALGLVMAARSVAVAMFGPLGWFGEPWSLDPRVRADLSLTPGGMVRVPHPWPALVAIGTAWLAVGVAPASASRASLARRAFVLASVLGGAFVASLAPIATQRAVAAAFAITLGVAVVLTGSAGFVERAGQPLVPLVGAAAAVVAAVGWAVTNRWMTVGALVASVIALIVLAAGVDHAWTWRPAAIAGAMLAAFGALTTACLAVGGAVTTTAVIVALAAAVVVVCASNRRPATEVRSAAVAVGVLVLVVAVLLAATSLPYLATVLMIAGAAFALASIGASTAYRWAAAVVGLSALVAWLVAAGVTLIEAYTVPIGATAIIGGGVLRRAEPHIGSWVAYGPGLAILFGPSVVASIDRGPTWRVLLLAVAAVVTIIVGAAAGLQAPIVIGAGALLALAINASVPVADEVPRWIPIGVAGLLLLWFGATFERRMTTVRRATAAFRRLD